MAKTKKQANTYEAVLNEIIETHGVSIKEGEWEHAVKYVAMYWDNMLDEVAEARDLELTPKEYAIGAVGNGLLDGHHMDGVEVTDLGNGLQLQVEKEQEIIEVDQDEVKKALRQLLTKGADGSDKRAQYLDLFYRKHEEYNDEYFFGALSYPLITIDKMNNKTLGNYTHGEDAMGITNHIRFNVNFVAMNTEERVLETLRHEMIHQWQDEIAYTQPGQDTKEYKRWVMDEEGKRVEVTEQQKRRPKEWHNKDFKEMASVVGIPAIGDKCYGNPAKMPEPKSYNRKFICNCVASNGHPLTIWSTRSVHAVCVVCEKPYREVKKGGKIIRVEQSHVEKPGEDAIEAMHKGKFDHFEKFMSKESKDAFLKDLNENEEIKLKKMVEGVYQKGHNAYKEGYTHWVAYNVIEVKKPEVEAPNEVEKPKRARKSKVEKTVEPTDNAVEKSKKRGRKPMDKKVEQPAVAVEVEQVEVEQVEVEQVEVEQVEVEQVEVAQPAVEQPKTDRSYKDKTDLIEIYKELGSIKAVAEYFNVTSGTIIYQAKKHAIDFNNLEEVGELS